MAREEGVASGIPAAVFYVVWPAIYASVAVVALRAGRRGSLLLRVALGAYVLLSLAWIALRRSWEQPSVAPAVPFLITAGMLWAALVGLGTATDATSRALLGLPIAWTTAALILQRP
jgi:tryptophan-rich sensory protein